ncbi:MAG: membrane protein insertion efficiency factor YidD [Acidobacteriales bacterium]|nr:membrane protein insertion efficiency factor YidD [Terriglobales bacterium]
MKAAVQMLLRAYKRRLSPALPPTCRFVPTCSEYAQEAVERHGVAAGLALSAWRIARCNPLFRGGLDPVPHHLHSQTQHGRHS